MGTAAEAVVGSSGSSSVWYKKLIDARTAEGIEVQLELDVEWEYDETRMSECVHRPLFPNLGPRTESQLAGLPELREVWGVGVEGRP